VRHKVTNLSRSRRRSIFTGLLTYFANTPKITAHCGRTNTYFVHKEICFRVLDGDFVGYFVYCTFFTSPFMNVIFLVYSLFHSDNFKWGKTREVVRSEGEKSEDSAHGRQMLPWSHSLITNKIDLLLLLYILFYIMCSVIIGGLIQES
jgi:hypothetical protein